MAKVSQCEQCDRYNKESGLCRNFWNLPEFDDVECASFGKDKPTKEALTEAGTIGKPLSKSFTSDEQLSAQPVELRQRHGCATAWLYFTLIGCMLIILVSAILLFTTNPNEEKSAEYIGYILATGIMLIAVILLFRWNIWGLYIILCTAIFNIFSAIFFDGNIGSSTLPLTVMLLAFMKEAKDGNTFFDNLGLTSRRKRIQKRLESYYINQSRRKFE